MKITQFNENDKIQLFNDTGVESVIYLYKDNDTLLKYFRDEEENKLQAIRDMYDYEMPRKTKEISKEILDNKEKKLEIISNRKSLEDEIEILSSVYSDKDFKGYLMKREYLNYLNTLPETFMDNFTIRSKKIAYLKLIKEKIEKLNSDGIFIGDFNEKNFLTDKNITIVKMCDLDNLKIDNLDFDTKHRLVQEYEKSNANPEYIDSYCFNLFTIAYLNKIFIGKHFFEKEEKLPKELRTKENRDIYESMYYLDSTYQKKYLIDNLR